MLIFGVLSLGVIAVLSVRLAASDREEPARCAPGFVEGPTRCCPRGQIEEEGRCGGTALVCSKEADEPGCVRPSRRVAIAEGALHLAPVDWVAEGRVEARNVEVQRFWLDDI
jgi:hypothetical protein